MVNPPPPRRGVGHLPRKIGAPLSPYDKVEQPPPCVGELSSIQSGKVYKRKPPTLVLRWLPWKLLGSDLQAPPHCCNIWHQKCKDKCISLACPQTEHLLSSPPCGAKVVNFRSWRAGWLFFGVTLGFNSPAQVPWRRRHRKTQMLDNVRFRRFLLHPCQISLWLTPPPLRWSRKGEVGDTSLLWL